VRFLGVGGGLTSTVAALGCSSLLAAWACSDARRPPELGGSVSTSADEGGALLEIHPSDASAPTCNLAPNGGVCACVDQTLLGNPPNLYFILDRSASMAEDDKWQTVSDVLEELVVKLGPRINVGAAVFPDPIDDGCAPGTQVFAVRRGDAPAGQAGPTAEELVSTLGHIGPEGGTPTAATIKAVTPMLQKLGPMTYVVLATDGGPNCDSNASCDIANCQLNIESVAGCTPTGPTNCCDPANASNGALSCLDAEPTIQAVQTLAASGIPVFVVGVPGSTPYADVLDQLAMAGGEPRPVEPLYYDVASADPSAFEQAIFKIAATVTGSCTLQLSNAPPDPTLVNVFFDEQPLPTGSGCNDDVDGDAQAGGADSDGDETQSVSVSATCNWTLRGQTIQILGASCNRILDGEILDVRVVAGCPTVVH
jgi:hypothetical protein